MNLDVEINLSAVERSVSSLERDGQPARAVTISRIFDTTLENLWDAVTSQERIPRWSLPVSGDLKAGGRYQLEGNAGGIITQCVNLSHFALTWEFGGDVSWVEVNCSSPETNRARLTVIHTAHLSEHWEMYGPGAVGVGWECAFLGLSLHIADPAEPMPDEAEFAASAEGRAFIAGSSNEWAQASVEAGTEPAAAQRAANLTTAFYTGESAEPD